MVGGTRDRGRSAAELTAGLRAGYDAAARDWAAGPGHMYARLAEALVAAAPERIMWGTDWPHPNKYVVNPNDGDLVDALGDWVSDAEMRRKIMVDTPAAFYRF